MDVLIPLLALMALVAGAVVWRARETRRMRHHERDDTARVGDAECRSGEAAARRSQGTQAWTRMSDSAGL
ncbi:hypothetical protein [Microbacterium kunmingense]|uniref:hypothetical protein n=1 Tax=Microbacterium kunmingense TaxID=2915939 RepID=UPI003D70EAED